MQERGVEMLVHLVHREHTLSLLGMQSLCRGLQYRTCRMVYGKTGYRLTDKQGTAELYGASSHEWEKVVPEQRAYSLILIVSLSP